MLVIVAVDESEQRSIESTLLKFNQREALKNKVELGFLVNDNIGIGIQILQHMLEVARLKKLNEV